MHFLPAGGELARWIANNTNPPLRGRSAVWLYRWRGYWFDVSQASQEALTKNLSNRNAFKSGEGLLLVMGLWRSGTTLLHEQLMQRYELATPTTHQCMNPAQFFLQPSAGKISTQRPMDAGIIHADSPQEDEFALMAYGIPSIYRAFIDPQRLDELLPTLSPDYWSGTTTERWLPQWLWFLRACANGAPACVAKSPNHSFRWPAIHHALPAARYVLILRKPQQLWQSNQSMWRAMWARYAQWAPQSDTLDRLLTEAMSRYAEVLAWALNTLSREQCCVIHFDSLAANDGVACAAVGRRFQLPVRTQTTIDARWDKPQYSPASSIAPAQHQSLFKDIERLQNRLMDSLG